MDNAFEDFLSPHADKLETTDEDQSMDKAMKAKTGLPTEKFVNRELSILEFNRRVLAQATIRPCSRR